MSEIPAATPSTSGTTTETVDSAPTEGTASQDLDGRAASTAPADGESDELDLESVPANLRPHVEKYAKKYEKDFKGAYTRKFQDLSAKEKAIETERAAITEEREKWLAVAKDVLKDPKKLDAYRKIYNIEPDPQSEVDEIPEGVQTVGDLLKWNKQQLASQRDALKAELLNESKNIVQSTLTLQKWEEAFKQKSADKHFVKYQSVIQELAKKDHDLQAKYRAGQMTEVQVLTASQEKLRAMLREDMEEVKAMTLAEQRKKAAATTAAPTKTLPMASKAATTKEEVIARVRERLGPG